MRMTEPARCPFPTGRRWSLHGSDETMDTALRRMPHLTSLDISNCSLEELPPVLAQDPADEAATRGGGGSGSEEEEDGAGRAAAGPRLLRLLAHGNQLEAGGEPDEEQAHLVFPRWELRRASLGHEPGWVP